MTDFLKTIEEEINNVYKFRDTLTGTLAADESLKLMTMNAWIREQEALSRATYQSALWDKLQEKDGDKPMSFSKAEAYAKAQPAYYDFLKLQGLAETIIELSYSLRVKAKGDLNEYKATENA